MIKRTFGNLVLVISLTMGSLLAAQRCEVLHNQQTFFAEKLRINLLLRIGFAASSRQEAAAQVKRIGNLRPAALTPRCWWQFAGESDALKTLTSRRSELDRLQRLFLASRIRKLAEPCAKKSIGVQVQAGSFPIDHVLVHKQVREDAATQTDVDGEKDILLNRTRELETQLGDAQQELGKQKELSDGLATECEQVRKELGMLDGLRGQMENTLAIFQKDKTALMKKEAATCTEMVAALQEQIKQIDHAILVAQFLSAIRVMGTSVFMINRIFGADGKKVPENSAGILGVCKEFIGKLPEQKDEILALKEQFNRCGEHAYDALAELAANALERFKLYATPQRCATGISDWRTQGAGATAFWKDFSHAIGRVAPEILNKIVSPPRLGVPTAASKLRSPSPIPEADSST